MTWDPDPWGDAPSQGQAPGRSEAVELVGTHLRMNGTISIGRFNRLSDLVNHSRGYVRIQDARLLRRNGDPTSLVLPEILVNQDEISFIGQAEGVSGESGSGGDASERPAMDRAPRRVVLFTPGHTLSGLVYLFRDADLLGFIDSNDPRFVPMTEVKTRSLADRRIIGHYAFALVNRTQMLAASEADPGAEIVI